MNWRSLHELYNATRQDSSEINALPPPLHTQNSTLISLGCPAQELRATYAMDTKTDGWGPTLNTSDERRQCGNRVRESGSDEGGSMDQLVNQPRARTEQRRQAAGSNVPILTEARMRLTRQATPAITSYHTSTNISAYNSQMWPSAINYV